MLRHWFTMYLLTVAQLDRSQVSLWRGDKNSTSLETYIHENGSLIAAFEKSTAEFQEEIITEGELLYDDGRINGKN